MRFLMKVSLPVEKANAAAKDGSLAKTIQSIVTELNPEAAYFATDGQGRRSGYLFLRHAGTLPDPGCCRTLVPGVQRRCRDCPDNEARGFVKGRN